MAKKPSKRTRIQGDVNITNGDLVAGDKTIAHDGDDSFPVSDRPARKKRASKPKNRDINNLDVSRGDVVFGDKIIKFFQENLNIYVFKDIQQLALFLGFLILISGAIGGGYWYSIQPKKMTGNYNIAIAQFGEIQADGTIQPSQYAARIRSRLFNFLDGEYKISGLGLNVQVANANMPLIIEDSQAEKLANKINADIVIYGTVSVQQSKDQADFQPRFYVAEQPDTKEITGTSKLAVPITFAISELNTDDGLNSQLRTRTEILFNFTKALIYFSQKDYDLASRTMDSAILAAEDLPDPFDGQEVLYLLEAKIDIQQKDYDKANQMLDQAFELNPNYARAHLARGNIYYEQGQIIYEADKPATYHEDLLLKAKTEYEAALNTPDQPEGAYIPIKARTNLGNVCFNLALIHGGDAELFSQATSHYTYVVKEFERTQDPFLKSYAAIAYSGLGGIYKTDGKIDQALEAYQQAYKLTDEADFKQGIKRQIESLQGK
jgi:tetratricopeptide (TPR) repeat protein